MTGGNGNGRPPIKVRIDEFKPMQKNTLQGFLAFTFLDLGLCVKGATIHQKQDSRWVSMPAREYQTDEGRKWVPVIEFDSRESRYSVNDAVIAAFDAFQARTTKPDPAPDGEPW